MRVQEVKIKDFKAIHNFVAQIEGKNVFIKGENGQGKSSLMQFIKIAGGNIEVVPPNTQGEGTVIFDKNGNKYTVNVKIKDGKSIIEVVTSDGLKDNRKSAIAGLSGAIDFDVNNFVLDSETSAGRKKQIELFKSMLDEDSINVLNKIQQDIKAHEETRTRIGQEEKSLLGYIKEHKLFGTDLNSYSRVNIDEIKTQLEQANEKNRKIQHVKLGVEGKEADINKNIAEIQRLEALITELKANNVKLAEDVENGKVWLGKNIEVDVNQLQTDLANAAQKNADFEQSLELKAKMEAHAKLKESYGEMTALIESSREEYQNTVKSLDNPIDGLSFDDEQLLFNGYPVSKDVLSTSEIIELGIKMFMAINSEFKVLFIENSNIIGLERWKLILDIAKKNNLQVFAEEVVRGQEMLTLEIIPEND